MSTKILILTKRLSRLESLAGQKSFKDIGNIVVIHDSKRGIDILDKSNFDLIIADYEIDEILSGIQVLEHIREISKTNPMFILSTPIAQASTSLAAIEFDSDDIIMDNVDPKDFVSRVKKVLSLKYVKNEIRGEMKNGNMTDAEKLCIEQIKNKGKAQGWCLRKRIEILALKKNYRYLEKITREILEKQSVEFVQVGLIEALYGQSCYQDAKECAEESTKNFPCSVSSYILMGDCYISMNQPKEATRCYAKASSISPLSVRAKQKLAETSGIAGNAYQIAKSYSMLAETTQNTFHESDENLINLAAGMAISGIDNKNSSKELAKASEILKSAARKNPENKKIRVHALIMEANRLIAKNDLEKAAEITNAISEKYFHQIESDSFALMALSSTYRRLKIDDKANYYQHAAELLSSSVKETNNTETAYLSYVKGQAKRKEAATLNAVGIDCYKAQDFTGAVESLLDALAIRPNQPVYSFNLLRVILKAIETDKHDSKMLEVFEDKLSYLEQIKENDKFSNAYNYVEKKWNEFKSSKLGLA